MSLTVLMIIGSSQVGGAEKQFARLAREIRKDFNLVILVIGKEGPYLPIYSQIGCKLYLSKNTVLSDVYTSFKVIRKVRPEVTLLWLYRANVIGAILSKLLRVPRIIITARNTNWPRNNLLKRKLLLLAACLANCIVANSDRAAKFHQTFAMNNHKFQIIRNFIDEGQTNSFAHSRKIEMFGLAARPVPNKGHKLAIEALQLVKNEGHVVRLSIAGIGVENWRLLTELKQIHNLDIDLIDNLLNLEDWFRNVDCSLALSDSWDSDSNFVLESIMNGIPVISSTTQAIEDIYGFQRIVNPLTPRSIADQIIQVITLIPSKRNSEIVRCREVLKASRNTCLIHSLWCELIRG